MAKSVKPCRLSLPSTPKLAMLFNNFGILESQQKGRSTRPVGTTSPRTREEEPEKPEPLGRGAPKTPHLSTSSPAVASNAWPLRALHGSLVPP